MSLTKLAMTLLISLAVLTSVFAESPVPFLRSAYPNICTQVETSMLNARQYYMSAVSQSYANVTKTQHPIQADLYILVHFLLFQSWVHFTQSAKNEDYWTKNIAQYFLTTFKSGLWENEGCLMIKVLIGFENQNLPKKNIMPLAAYYTDFIKQQWHDEGVGECFSKKIERTYGSNLSIPTCTGINPELDAKVAYYQAMTKYADNPLLIIKTPSLNRGFQKNMQSWFEIVPEKWVIMTYQRQKRSLVSLERYQMAVKNVETGIKQLRLDLRVSTSGYLDLLLFSHLLNGSPLAERIIKMVQTLMAAQQPDGSFPLIGNVRALVQEKKHHNVNATPTYMALLALHEFKKRYPCASLNSF